MTVKLSEIEKAAEGATPGPWDASGTSVGTRWSGAADWSGPIDDRERVADATAADATFIAASRAAIPALTAALRDVLALHRPVRYAGADSPAIVPRFVCDACIAECDGAIPYPCATVRAITAHVDPT